MVDRKLNDKGIILTSMIITILLQYLILNVNSIIGIITTPLIFGISLIISSNIKFKTKKELAKPAKVQS